jgi:hypothetical protein
MVMPVYPQHYPQQQVCHFCDTPYLMIYSAHFFAAKEADMPVRLVVANSENNYLATDAAILIDAFEAALNELGLADRNDPAVLAVANRIIAFAKVGVLDPSQLRDLTIRAVQKERRPESGNWQLNMTGN